MTASIRLAKPDVHQRVMTHAHLALLVAIHVHLDAIRVHQNAILAVQEAHNIVSHVLALVHQRIIPFILVTGAFSLVEMATAKSHSHRKFVTAECKATAPAMTV